jgi:hypothetical protein
MDFTALKAELAARGFDYLSDTRLGQYINWANSELDDAELWPYRLQSLQVSAGASFGTPPGLGPVAAVRVSLGGGAYRPLAYMPLGDVLGAGEPGTGSATHYYVNNDTLGTWPAESRTWYAWYYAIADDLAAGADHPLAPTRYHGLIVDMAVQRAYRDNDDHDAAAALQGEIDRQLNNMRNALLLDHTDGPTNYIAQRAGWVW